MKKRNRNKICGKCREGRLITVGEVWTRIDEIIDIVNSKIHEQYERENGPVIPKHDLNDIEGYEKEMARWGILLPWNFFMKNEFCLNCNTTLYPIYDPENDEELKAFQTFSKFYPIHDVKPIKKIKEVVWWYYYDLPLDHTHWHKMGNKEKKLLRSEHKAHNHLLLTNRRSRMEYHDPHESFGWGGLSDEEAYDGYWNTE